MKGWCLFAAGYRHTRRTHVEIGQVSARKLECELLIVDADSAAARRAHAHHEREGQRNVQPPSSRI